MARRAEPWRRSQSGAWYAWVGGKQTRLAPAGAPKDAAWKALDALRGDSGPRKAPTAAPTVEGVLAAFLGLQGERRKAGEIEPATLEHYLTRLEPAIRALGERPAASLTPEDVTRWAASRGWSSATQRASVLAVRAAFRHAVRSGVLERDPLAGIRLPADAKREFDATERVRARVLDAAPDPAWSDFLTACVQTGARPGEVASVTAADFDAEAGTWVVRHKTRRRTGRPTRTVYLTPVMVEMCRRLAAEHPTGPLFRNSRGRPWRRSAWGVRMRRERRRLGLPEGMCVYSLRHAFGTDSVAAGANPVIVAELMGHQSTDQLVRTYSNIAQRRDALRATLGKIRGEAPGPSTSPAARPPTGHGPARAPEDAPDPAPRSAARRDRRRSGPR